MNLGRGEALHIRELVDALVRATGLPPESIRERPGDVAGRSAGADWIRVDNSRAGRLLGWRPRYDVDASMRDLWDTVRPAPPMSGRASSGSPNSATTVLCEVDPARRRRSPRAGTAAVGGDVPVSARAAAARGLELRSIPPRDLVADRPPSGGSGKEHV
ncbi:hypothetical protein ACGFZZ_37025 [Streptomyces tendae]|uniref:hypothetical protein n=1 Tax=Streptomyces tendae TaxID=1932 RepID=UPI0033E5411C